MVDVGAQVRNLNRLRKDRALSAGNEENFTPSHLTKLTTTEHWYVPGTRQSNRKMDRWISGLIDG